MPELTIDTARARKLNSELWGSSLADFQLLVLTAVITPYDLDLPSGLSLDPRTPTTFFSNRQTAHNFPPWTPRAVPAVEYAF
jgi:hypothetical protein